MARYVRICPKCKSRDISHDMSGQAYGAGTIFNQFKCNKCGYTGIFFPEVEEKVKGRKKKS